MRDDRPPRWLIAGTSMLAVLVAIASLGGIWEPSIYAKETASWAAQGLGQDLVDLLVIVPVLLGCAWGVARESRAAMVVLAGVLIYVVYSFLLYALAMHFNALFLVYCGVLGVAFYSLVDVGLYLGTRDGRLWFAPTVRRSRTIGWFLLAISGAFYALWLAAVIPALLDGTTPASIVEAGLITNPVHVLDLALALPAIALSGVLLLAGRPAGYLLAPIMLAFGAAMGTAIIGMNVAMYRSGLSAQPAVTIAMAIVALANTVLLAGYLRQMRPARPMGWLDEAHRL